MNRLKLDFNLETALERKQFIDTYIVQFVDEKGVSTLTSDELNTISNYLLWGKDGTKALGADTELESKWSKSNETESLDAVFENPALANIQLKPLNEAIVYRKPRVVFSRSETRANAPVELRETFENLWRTIDETDLLINFYELHIGKREKPPRAELINQFSDEDVERIRRQSEKLTQFTYLKKRHQLIELRRQQFTLQDSYQSTFNIVPAVYTSRSNSLVFDCDVEVLPLGIVGTPGGKLIFDTNFDPGALNDQQLHTINKLVWDKKNSQAKRKFDFRNLEDVYQLYLYKEEINEQIERDIDNHNSEANQSNLIETLNFYEQIADLTEPQFEILRLKEQKVKNQEIANYINKKYQKSYTANYISTIFRQKIIVKINEAAELHRETIENCFFPENFKRCVDCGRVLLLDGRNWVRKSRSKDGFQNRCKKCEREGRKKK